MHVPAKPRPFRFVAFALRRSVSSVPRKWRGEPPSSWLAETRTREEHCEKGRWYCPATGAGAPSPRPFSADGRALSLREHRSTALYARLPFLIALASHQILTLSSLRPSPLSSLSLSLCLSSFSLSLSPSHTVFLDVRRAEVDADVDVLRHFRSENHREIVGEKRAPSKPHALHTLATSHAAAGASFRLKNSRARTKSGARAALGLGGRLTGRAENQCGRDHGCGRDRGPRGARAGDAAVGDRAAGGGQVRAREREGESIGEREGSIEASYRGEGLGRRVGG